VFHKLAVRNVFVAVAFELHLSDDVVQQIAGGVSISSQKMVAADTFTTIDLTADALAALPGSTRKGKIVRKKKVELGEKENKISHPPCTLCHCKCQAGGVGGNMCSSVAPF
jgi:hypothetical protein